MQAANRQVCRHSARARRAPPTDTALFSGATLRQPAPGLLANDAAGDTATARLASPPAYGQVTIEPDGAFVYEPKWRFNGRDSFSYQIINGDVISEHIWCAYYSSKCGRGSSG